ncbi:hypothetical protein ACKP2L_07840 [Oenococcus alcoholitolerans]
MAKKKKEKFQTIRNTEFSGDDSTIDNLFAKIKKQEEKENLENKEKEA